MTIIVGIICTDGIAMACDSQTTIGDGAAKRLDTSKITVIEMQGKQVLIGEAGDATLSARCVEILQAKLKGVPMDDYRKPADACEQAIKSMKEQLVALNNWGNRPDALEDYLMRNPVTLMMAYYFDKIPYLYVLNMMPGFATRQKSYAAIGCGGTVGEFILSRADTKSMPYPRGLIASIYTVEEVKRVDPFCGGPTKAAVMGPDRVIYSEDDSDRHVKCALEALANCDKELRKNWNQLTETMLNKVEAQWRRTPKRETPAKSASNPPV